jgi:hypothetical protein
MEDHDVRYIFRSVGKEGEPPEPVGGIFERYFFRETLGKGTFAEVKKAVEISTGMVRAVKVSLSSSTAGWCPAASERLPV